jgi:serine/threonine protein kinase
LVEKNAALIIKIVLKAISHCHDQGVVHRDLKPENILLENHQEFEKLKIVDFGVAKNFEKNK